MSGRARSFVDHHGQPLGQALHRKGGNVAKAPLDRAQGIAGDHVEPGEVARQVGLRAAAQRFADAQVGLDRVTWCDRERSGSIQNSCAAPLPPATIAATVSATCKAFIDRSLQMLRMILSRALALSMALLLTFAGPARAHEIRPTIADVEVGAERVTLTLRITLETLLAGIDLATVEDTNDAPEAALYDRFRAMEPDRLEAALRADWPRIARGFLIEVEGQRLTPEIAGGRDPGRGEPSICRATASLTIAADLPPGEAGVRLGLAPGYGTFVPRQVGGGEDAYEGFLSGGEMTPDLPRADV